MLRTRILLSIVVLGPWCCLFGRTLSGQRTFAFRDAAHYYYPLFQWAQTEWGAGRVPLWNPQENCGVPALAETAASVFYPPKLLFATPLPYVLQYNLFVVAHVLLAVLTAYLLARRFRASRLAATLAGLSFGFGGNVLFQYCNVVFLVGAAWLPLGLLAGERLLRTRRWRWALALGTVLALMTLGGDPQSAYHTLLLVGLYAGIRAWRVRSRAARGRRQARRSGRRARQGGNRLPGRSPQRSGPQPGRIGEDRWRQVLRCWPVLLLASAAWGGVLAAVQILPAMNWTRQSERAIHDAPRNLYEAAVLAARPAVSAPSPSDETDQPAASDRWALIGQGLLGPPQPGAHHEHVFQFSVGPWRLPELLWPNISGRLFPTNRRWLNVVPAEGRVWNPSLYIGLLPILLAAWTWQPWSRRRRVAWMSWAVLLAGLGALGWYGLGWLALEIHAGWLGRDPHTLRLGPQVGGVYWLLTTMLPGYVYFRFPAKLLVVASLGLSVLAAWGWDNATARSWRAIRRLLTIVAGLSGTGLVVALACRGRWATWLSGVPSDEFFGPLDAAGAHGDLTTALTHTLLLSALLWCVLRVSHRISSPMRGAILLLITATELSVAQGWSIPTAPAELWTRPSAAATAIARHHASAHDGRSSRVFRGSLVNWRPDDWRLAGSSQRMLEAVAWERDSLFPKYHLLSDVPLVEAYGTIASADFLAVMRVARQHGSSRPNHGRQPHCEVLRALNAGYYLLPASGRIPGSVALPADALSHEAGTWPEDVRLWHDPARRDRAWIVHEVAWLPPLDRPSRQAIEGRTRAVFFPDGRPRCLERQAVVEAFERPPLELAEPLDVLAAAGDESSQRCRIVLDLPDRVEVRVELSRAGLLVLSDLYTEDWRAELTSAGQPPREVPVWRTNRIMRGVSLPAGESQVVFRYRPRAFYLGAAISAGAWTVGLALLAGWLTARLRGRMRTGT